MHWKKVKTYTLPLTSTSLFHRSVGKTTYKMEMMNIPPDWQSGTGRRYYYLLFITILLGFWFICRNQEIIRLLLSSALFLGCSRLLQDSMLTKTQYFERLTTILNELGRARLSFTVYNQMPITFFLTTASRNL